MSDSGQVNGQLNLPPDIVLSAFCKILTVFWICQLYPNDQADRTEEMEPKEVARDDFQQELQGPIFNSPESVPILWSQIVKLRVSPQCRLRRDVWEVQLLDRGFLL